MPINRCGYQRSCFCATVIDFLILKHPFKKLIFEYRRPARRSLVRSTQLCCSPSKDLPCKNKCGWLTGDVPERACASVCLVCVKLASTDRHRRPVNFDATTEWCICQTK